MSVRIAYVALLLVACSDGPVTPPDLAPADPCAPLGRLESGVCTSRVDFAPGPSMTKARDHHGTAIVETSQGAFLYVTGGTNYSGIFRDALVSRINGDGSLEGFRETTSLPAPRAGHGVIVHARRMYLIAGQNTAFLSSVISAPIAEDGSLGAWEDEPSLPGSRFHIAAAASGTHVYAIGGVESPDGAFPFLATRTVYRAAFGDDGRLGSWQTTELPEPRSHHAVVHHDGALYLIGGLTRDNATGSPVASDVLVSRLGADGAPGPFVAGGSFDEPVLTHAAFELQGSLYMVGGLTDGDTLTTRIRRAPFLADGNLGPFVDAGELPEGRSHVHHTPYHAGHLYTMGGSIDYRVVTDAVHVGRFTPPAATAVGSSSHALRGTPLPRGAARCPCARARISIPE